jgi:prohibitin 1
MSFFANIARLAVGLGVAGTAVSYSMYNVEGGQRVVIFDRLSGVQQQLVGEGTHFLIPWLQRPVNFDVRIRPRRIETMTGSKDMQMVKLTLRVLHRPDLEHLPEIWQNYGVDYDDRILPSIGNEILKATVAQYDAAELITQREVVSMKIREDLVKRANSFHLILEDISIVDLTFSREFTQAVEQKQVAQQEAERAKFTVEKAEQEKLAAVIRAEGESTAATLISQALQESGQGLIELRRIEAAKDIASTLSQSRNVTYIPGQNGGNQSLLLNLGA